MYSFPEGFTMYIFVSLLLTYIHIVLGLADIPEYVVNCDKKTVIDSTQVKEGVLRSHDARTAYPEPSSSCTFIIIIPKLHRLVLTKEFFNLYSEHKHSSAESEYSDNVYINNSNNKEKQSFYQDNLPERSAYPKNTAYTSTNLNINFKRSSHKDYKYLARVPPAGFKIHFRLAIDINRMASEGRSLSFSSGYKYLLSPNYPDHAATKFNINIIAKEGQQFKVDLIQLSMGKCNQNDCCSRLLFTGTTFDSNYTTCGVRSLSVHSSFSMISNKINIEYDPIYNGENKNKNSSFLVKLTVLGCDRNKPPKLPTNSNKISSTGKELLATCEDGYVQRLPNGNFVKDKLRSTCEESTNKWNKIKSKCYPSGNITCTKPNITNGRITGRLTYGSQTRVHCNNNFKAIGPTIWTCTLEETWSGANTTCQPIQQTTDNKATRNQGTTNTDTLNSTPTNGESMVQNSTDESKGNKLYLILGIAGGSSIVVLVVCVVLAIYLIRKRKNQSHQTSASIAMSQVNEPNIEDGPEPDETLYSEAYQTKPASDNVHLMYAVVNKDQMKVKTAADDVTADQCEMTDNDLYETSTAKDKLCMVDNDIYTQG